jgi:hypothetical protein
VRRQDLTRYLESVYARRRLRAGARHLPVSRPPTSALGPDEFPPCRRLAKLAAVLVAAAAGCLLTAHRRWSLHAPR